MVRARENGILVPRYQVGRQRAVRGTLLVGEVQDKRLARHVRTARFMMENIAEAEPPVLRDVQFIHASAGMWVLGGFEQIDEGLRIIEYAQTWILAEPKGAQPEGQYGPPFLG